MGGGDFSRGVLKFAGVAYIGSKKGFETVLLADRERHRGSFMRTRARISLRQLIFCVGCFAGFMLLTVFLFTYRRDERVFENVVTKLFREEMSANTLNMHYTIAYPDNFGIHDYTAVLPCYSGERRLRSQAETENLAATLNGLDKEELSEENQYTLELLLETLNLSLEKSKYAYFEEPLSPSSGMQSQLPILLAEYSFRTKRDVEDYLNLLDQTDEYFQSLLVFEQEKAEAGLLMSATSLKKVIEQCDTILDKQSLEDESHFLQSTFRERLAALVNQGLLTKDEAMRYVSQNNRLLRTVMRPAYEALADGLCLLEDDSIPLAGLAGHQNGAAYYSLLLASETGSDRPVSEIMDLLLEQLSSEFEQIKELLTQNPALLTLDYEKGIEQAFPYRSAVQMLADLQEQMRDDFPPFAAYAQTAAQIGIQEISGQTIPDVAVKSVSESLQEYCAPAFFLTPPIDDTSSNVIYINEKNSPSGLNLYTTLAHEGYPGHLYQSVFYNRLLDNSAAAQARQLLWYGGYLEGWALYVEFISFDYASNLFLEREEPLLAAAVQLERHNRSLQLCLYSLLDIMIHYENASVKQVAKILDSLGLNGDSANIIFEYIAEEPANYPKYYLGYLEILELRKLAQELWQDDYNDYDFHSFFLECGPSGFTQLRKKLMETISPDNTTLSTKISDALERIR